MAIPSMGLPFNRVDRAFMASISARCPSLQGLTPQCGACLCVWTSRENDRAMTWHAARATWRQAKVVMLNQRSRVGRG